MAQVDVLTSHSLAHLYIVQTPQLESALTSILGLQPVAPETYPIESIAFVIKFLHRLVHVVRNDLHNADGDRGGEYIVGRGGKGRG